MTQIQRTKMPTNRPSAMSGFLKRAARILAVPLALVCSSFSLWASDAPLVADTYISFTSPTAAFGAMPFLHVSATDSALVQFDLSAYPPNTTVNKAYLRLYVN